MPDRSGLAPRIVVPRHVTHPPTADELAPIIKLPQVLTLPISKAWRVVGLIDIARRVHRRLVMLGHRGLVALPRRGPHRARQSRMTERRSAFGSKGPA